MRQTTSEFILYIATSTSGKKYIGITATSLDDRISKHKYSSTHDCKDTKFSKAIRKYGIENMDWQVVLKGMTQMEAKHAEILFIKYYGTYKSGYNSTKGGEGAWGYVWDKKEFSVHHEKRREKYYNNAEWCKNKGEITKQWYRDNPEKAAIYNNNSADRFRNRSESFEKKRIAGLNSYRCKERQALSRGCEKFNVYNLKDETYIGTWLVRSVCAKELGLSNGKISSCLNGVRHQHKGYIFKRIDDPTVNGKKFNPIWWDKIRRSDWKKN